VAAFILREWNEAGHSRMLVGCRRGCELPCAQIDYVGIAHLTRSRFATCAFMVLGCCALACYLPAIGAERRIEPAVTLRNIRITFRHAGSSGARSTVPLMLTSRRGGGLWTAPDALVGLAANIGFGKNISHAQRGPWLRERRPPPT